jgi:cobalt-zinc-cadmium efflux system membrane fusion protein
MNSTIEITKRVVVAVAAVMIIQFAWAAEDRDHDAGHDDDSHVEHAQDDHDDHDEHEGEDEAVKLSAAERQSAGVETGIVAQRVLSETLRLPGEVIPNIYKSAMVAPRITAQIVRRHARLGDEVVVGQAMVTLSSVEMADAQGALLVADQEFQRVQSLGKDVVSDRRYIETQVARQQALSKVLAYGMTEVQANRLLKSREAAQATGAFDLLAPIAGVVLSDDFVLGELIEPGRVIFEIIDEATLWVEARTSANKAASVSVGMPARISPDQAQWRDAEVVQIHHRLDEATRTQAVHVEFANTGDWLHPGQFVEVEIAAGAEHDVLAVPAGAVVLMKGDNVVFRLEAGDEFHPVSVIIGTNIGGWAEIQSGLAEGDVIAISGAYFLKSMVLKSEMGEGHVH